VVEIKVYIGSDHAGFELKEKLKPFLKKLKYTLVDLGAKTYNKLDDYPIYGEKVAKAVSKDKRSFGILICGSGQGICIAANKVNGIRAALCENVKDAFTSRNDDNANVLCLQGKGTSLTKTKSIVKKFLETEFSDEERHNRRINEIKKIEK